MAMRVDDRHHIGPRTINPQVRRCIGARSASTVDDPPLQIDHNHVFRCHLFVEHSGRLNNHQARFRVQGRKVAASPRDKTRLGKHEIPVEYFFAKSDD